MSLGLKVLSESLSNIKKDSFKDNSKIYTIQQINENLISSYNKMKSIKEQVEDIKSQWKSLQEDVECFSFAKVVYEGDSIRESFQKAVDDLKLEYEDAKNNYIFYKNLRNKVLTESESIIAPNDLYTKEDTPFSVEVEEKIDDSTNNNSNVEDYSYITDELDEIINKKPTEVILQYLFDELVPESGKSSTYAGELVRSIMDLIYNAKANDYYFYKGDGLSACGSSAQYLREHGYEDEFASIIDDVYSLTKGEYLKHLALIADMVIREIYENPNYLSEPNTIDSRYYDYSDIESISPIYEYDIEIPQEITNLYDNNFNVYNILEYIKETFDEDGIKDYSSINVSDSRSKTILITDVDTTTLDYLKGLFEDSKFWEDYYDSLTSDLEEDLQIIHDTLNEMYSNNDDEGSNLVDIFMQYHEDYQNYRNNPSSYDQVYAILDKYGSEDEDVDIVFSRATEEEQRYMIDLIRPKDEYLN